MTDSVRKVRQRSARSPAWACSGACSPNRSTPKWAKAGFLITGTAYFVFSGGWIPFTGWLDDLIVLPALAWLWGQFLPRLFGWPVWNVFRREGKSI